MLRAKFAAVLLLFISLPTVLAQKSDDEASGVLTFLNQTATWYHSVLDQQQIGNDPADAMFADNSHAYALQVLRLSFEYARAEAAIIPPSEQADTQPTMSDPAQAARFADLVNAAQTRVNNAQNELDAARSRLDSAASGARVQLQQEVDAQKAELDLAQARLQTLRSFIAFANSTSGRATGLLGKIQELERRYPEARTQQRGQAASATSDAKSSDNASNAQASDTNAPSTATPAAQADTGRAQYGMIALTTQVFSSARKLRAEDVALTQTTALRDSVNGIRTPIMDRLRKVMMQADALAADNSTNPTDLVQRRKDLDAVTAQYKQLSAVLVPIAKISVLLDAERGNLTQWHAETERQYASQLRTLLMRIVVLVLIIAVVFIFSEIWRRATFRYVSDVRRRSQFLLLRRIVVTIIVAIVVMFSIATEVGSLATFAGLITAGVALALQNVILSVAAYFFLIGKYGIRVGDRVQIGSVVGDVVDIGLVRLHLMELDTTAGDPQPTGRVVVFSNSVVFQPTSNFFKQLPGTSFGWHRISISLSPDVDYNEARSRISDAVNKVYADYREEVSRQHSHLQRTLTLAVAMPEPHAAVRFRETSLEVSVRYPVLQNRVTAIDDRMTRAVLEAIDAEPKLKLVGGGRPVIQAVPEAKSK